MSESSPLYPNAIRGFRVFRLSPDRSQLVSIVERWPWSSSGPTRAECLEDWSHPDEPAPAQLCGCGLHSYYRPDHAASLYLHWKKNVIRQPEDQVQEPLLIACVRASGLCQMHAHGFRAERSEVVELFDPSGWLEGDEGFISSREEWEIELSYGTQITRDWDEFKTRSSQIAQSAPPPQVKPNFSAEDVELVQRLYQKATDSIKLQELGVVLGSQLGADEAGLVSHIAQLSGAPSARVAEDEARGDFSYARVLDQLDLRAW